MPPHPLLHLLLILPLLFSSLCSLALSASSNVTHLPGFSGPLPFHLESGYVGVDEVNGVELFYYFIQSEGSPGEDPLLLWLTGGPGCSAFSGLVFEIGGILLTNIEEAVEAFGWGPPGDPTVEESAGSLFFRILLNYGGTGTFEEAAVHALNRPFGPLKFRIAEYNGSLPTLFYNPYSWTKLSNIIFLDSPVGAGFSFSRNPKGYEVGDITSSKQVHKFLTKWFIEHPQFLSNPLYIAGDSYAGKVVPVIAQEISQDLDDGRHPLLNLKGYLIGNPLTGEKFDKNSRIPFAHGMGIISDELYEVTRRNCEGEDYRQPSNAQCAMNLDAVDKFFSAIDTAHILEPSCPIELRKPMEMIGSKRSLKEKFSGLSIPPPLPDLSCRTYAYYLSYYWANNYVVREALHIKKGTLREWQRCNNDLKYTKDIPSSLKYQRSLTTRGYRALVYSGDHDLIIPFLGTQAWIRSLQFPIVDDWRSWHVGGQVAGYTRTYSNNLTFATVKGAGHTAPEYRPKECLEMFRRWLSYTSL